MSAPKIVFENGIKTPGDKTTPKNTTAPKIVFENGIKVPESAKTPKTATASDLSRPTAADQEAPSALPDVSGWSRSVLSGEVSPTQVLQAVRPDAVSSGLKSRVNTLNEQIEQLKTADHTLTLTETNERKDQLAQLKSERDQRAEQYYYAENQEKQTALRKDPAAQEQYTSAQDLQADMDRITTVIGALRDARADTQTQKDQEYLAQKYGLSSLAVNAPSYESRMDLGGLSEKYGSLQALYDALEQQKKSAVETLAASGFDYGRMVEYEKTLQDAEQYAGKQAEWTQFAQEHPVVSSIGTVLNAPFQGGDYLTTVLSGIGRSDTSKPESYVPLNTYNMDATNFVSTVRGTVSQEIEERTDWELFGQNVVSFMYQTGMSVADSAVQVATMGKWATLVMGASAASNQAKDIIERGGTNKQAFWGGLAAGAAETVFEKVSIDQLLSTKSVTGWKSWLKETAKQAGTEASEEVFTEIANILADAAIMGDNSDFANAVKEYMAQGMSEEQAKEQAFLDCISQVAWAGAGGALSGATMGGVVNGVNGLLSRGGGLDVETRQDTQSAVQAPAQTGEEQSAAEQTWTARSDLLSQAAEQAAQNGSVSGKLADRIMADEAALETLIQETGLELPDGMTMSQRRAAVKSAAESLAGRRANTAPAAAQTARESAQARPVAQQAYDIKRIQRAASSLGENGAKALNAAYDGSVSADAFYGGFVAYYEAGVSGLDMDQVRSEYGAQLNEAQKYAAYAAGQNDAALAENRAARYIENTEGVTPHGEEVYLRDGGQRDGGTDPGGSVRAVEESAGRDQSGQAEVRSADSGAASLTYGKKVSTASLGIGRGSDVANIRIVTGGETAATRSAKALAKERGLRLTLFSGDNLSIKQADGSWASVRGYISGDRVFVRADHPRYTADQLMRHEAGHDRIAKGEINPDDVRTRIEETFGEDKAGALSQLYADAYEGSGLTAEQIWEEVICDSLGDMNIFAETLDESIAQELLEETKNEASADLEANRTRGPPAEGTETGVSDDTGKMSIETGFAQDLQEWYEEGQPAGERFTLGSTGPVLQGLGAIESDIYMNGDKISTILKEHPEMTLKEIQRIPEMLEDPVLILKSKGTGGGGRNSRLVIFGSVKAQNGQPVMAVLDLRPSERGFILDDMQKVNSAYTKKNPAAFVTSSEVLHADEKRAVPLLRSIGLTIASRRLLRNGSVGSITYSGDSVKLTGVEFSSMVDVGENISGAKSDFSRELDSIDRLREQKLADDMYYGRKMAQSQRMNQEKTAAAKQEARQRVADTKLADDMYYGRRLSELRRQRDTKVENLKEHYREKDAARRERTADSKARTRLLNIAKRLQNRKLPAVNRALLNQYIGELDTTAKSLTDKSVVKLSDLRAWYENERENNPDFISDPSVEKALTRLSQKQIADLTADEVADLTNVLLNIENELRTQKKLIDREEQRDTYQLGLEVISDVENTKGSSAGKSGTPGRYIVTETLSPVRQVRRMTGWVDSDPLYTLTNDLADGQRRMFDYQRRAGELFTKWTEDQKLTERITGKKAEEIEITGIGKDGPTTVRITPAMRMSLYLHSLNDQNLKHIAGGGVTVPDMALYKKGKIAEAYARGVTIKLTPSEVRSITTQMSEKERAFAAAACRYFNGMSQQSINEVSEKLKGYSLAQVENYFPINTDTSFTKSDFESLKFDGTIEGMGFLKERINSAAPILLRDMNSVLTQSIDSTAKYVGLAIPVRNFNKVWGVTKASYDKEGNRTSYQSSVQQAVKQKWGEDGYSYIENMMTDLNSGRPAQDKWSKALGKIKSNYAGAVLTLNASVAMKQAASYPTAGAVLGWKPLIKAMKDFGKVDLDLINKYTPLQWYRTQGFSTQELGDMAKRNKSLPKVLNWVQGVDLLTTRKLWKASEYYVRAGQKDLGVGTDAYYKAVADIYNRVIEETQPNYTTMQRPQLLRSENTLMQNLSMFKTQPFQNFNILYDAIGNLNAKKAAYDNSGSSEAKAAYVAAKKNAGRALTSQFVQLAVFAGMTFAWNMFRGKGDKYEDDEDEMTTTSVLAGIGKDMVGGAFSVVPFGSDVWELLSSKFFDDAYYGMDAVTVTALTDATSSFSGVADMLTDTVTALANGEAVDWNETRLKADRYFDDISKTLGIPYENVMNLFNAVFLKGARAVQGEYLGTYTAMKLTTSPGTYSGDYYDLLYKAYVNDPEAYETIYADMVEWDQFATSSKTTEEAIASALENRMKKDQGVESVANLESRYLSPAQQTEYDRALADVSKSAVWRSASAEQRETLEENLYDLTVGNSSGGKLQEKIDGGAAYGIDETDYLLYKLALQVVDQPTESGKFGSYTNDEIQDAIDMLTGLSDDAKAYLWEAQGKSEKSNPYR